MKKLFVLIAVFASALTLFAGKTQVALILKGKEAHLRVVDQGGLNVREKTQWDRRTGVIVFRCLYFDLTSRSAASPKNFKIKFEAEKGDLTVYIGHKKADTMLWTSLKVDAKEMITNPKKSELIGIKNFPVGKIDKKKEISFEGSFRMATKKELQAQKTALKNSKKNSKKSK